MPTRPPPLALLRPSRGWRLVALLGALAAVAASGSCGCEDPDGFDEVVVAIRLSPSTLDLGAVPVGGFVEGSSFVFNDGNTRLELTGPVELTDNEEGAFTILDAGTFPVAGGAFTALSVRFTPLRTGAYQARLRLPAASPAEPVDLVLVGEGAPAEVALAPDVLDFGDVEAGQSTTATLTVENRTDAAITVPLVVEGAGFLIDGSSRISLALEALEVREIEVRFLPDRGGGFSARARVELCGPLCGPFATLAGQGLAPRIDVSPRPLDFGDVAVGEVADGSLLIANEGVGNLVLSALQLNDSEGAILVVEGPSIPAVLGAGEAVRLDLRYAPQAPSGSYAATLLIDSSDPLQPRVSIPILARTEGAALRLLPEAAHFGLLEPGASRTVELVAVSVGTEPVEVTDVSVEGAAFSLVGFPPLLPLVLMPAESIVLGVEAVADPASVAAGGAGGSLHVSTTSTSHQASLAFTSGDMGCQPRSPSPNLNLGYMRVGEGAASALVVQNIGTAACTLDTLGPAAGLPFDPGFSWQVIDDVLEPGASFEVQVGYTAAGSGQARAFFDVAFEEREEPLLLSATATGVSGSLVPQPTGLELGPGVAGCSGQRRTLSFVNDGAQTVTIDSIDTDPPTPELIITHGATPAQVLPGAAFEVRVEAANLVAGSYSALLVAHTLELGDISGWLISEVSDAASPVTETFVVPEGGPSAVDILFIVDNSGSMYDDQQRLADNFAAFIEEAGNAGATSDFHIGVTSTDVLSDGALRGRLVGSPPYLTPGSQDLAGQFADQVTLGIEGTGLELGLEAMRFALGQPLASGANAGFHRIAAALSVIVVSDEDDSGGTPFAQQNVPEHARSVDSYVSFLSAVKGGVLTETPILFSAVVNTGASPRYEAMTSAFGGIALNIADPTWGEQLGAIGSATFGLQQRFRLANPFIDGSVEVRVDGVPTTAFTVDVTARTVVLDLPPPAGSVIEITYLPNCS